MLGCSSRSVRHRGGGRGLAQVLHTRQWPAFGFIAAEAEPLRLRDESV